MGIEYKQITLEERVEIYRLHKLGISVRKIGIELGRSAATISRELKRNSQDTKVWKEGYEPVRAEGLKERRRRRGRGFKLSSEPELAAHIKQQLAAGLSPEQIAGRLKQESGKHVISHEAIYRYIYYRFEQKDYWHKFLPRKHATRGHKRQNMHGHKIKNYTSIHQRPDDINNRQAPGHWEADLMMFRQPQHAMLVTVERTSRMIKLSRQQGKTANITLDNLNKIFTSLPSSSRQSITFDNGTEFTHHYSLTQNLGIQTFFCDPHKPWQKGTVENSIGRLRRFLPSNTNLDNLSDADIAALQNRYNNTPRKCLGFLTPNESYAIHHPSTVALHS